MGGCGFYMESLGGRNVSTREPIGAHYLLVHPCRFSTSFVAPNTYRSILLLPIYGILLEDPSGRLPRALPTIFTAEMC